MRIDFTKEQDKIKDYIEHNLNTYLINNGVEPIDAFIDDFIDLDKFKKKNQLFYNFEKYNFSTLSSNSNKQTLEFSVFLACRGASNTELKVKVGKQASVFYEMFEDSGTSLGGIADDGEITGVTFYYRAEGSVNIKVAEINITLSSEV